MNKKLIWIITAIVGAYVTAQLIADVGATRLIEINGVIMPGGTFVFALTFTLRDLIHKRLGKEWARAAIVAAAGANLFLAAYMGFIGSIPAPEFYQNAEAWTAIFAIVPAITLGSIAAELVSQLTDTEVYHFIWTRFPNAPQWVRVLASNLVALPIDTLVFTLLAFVFLPPLFGATAMPLGSVVARLAGGQIIFKAIVAIVSMPLIYLVSEKPLVEQE